MSSTEARCKLIFTPEESQLAWPPRVMGSHSVVVQSPCKLSTGLCSSNYSPHGSVSTGADRRQVLIALRDFPHGFVELLSVKNGSFLVRHSCGLTTSSPAVTKQASGNFCPLLRSSLRVATCCAAAALPV